MAATKIEPMASSDEILVAAPVKDAAEGEEAATVCVADAVLELVLALWLFCTRK